MKSLWHILNIEEIRSPICDIGISEKVLSVRMLPPCDTKEEETAKAEDIHCPCLTTFFELLWSLPTSATRPTFPCTNSILRFRSSLWNKLDFFGEKQDMLACIACQVVMEAGTLRKIKKDKWQDIQSVND